MKPLERLSGLVGGEHQLADLPRELKFLVHELRPAVIGALQVTCADETERECAEAFQRGVVHDLLPRLKYGQRAPFRLANLGAQYQWGAGNLASEHFPCPDTAGAFKLMVFKLNAHVAVDATGSDVHYGILRRYGVDSTCCGALNALLAGASAPFLDPLRDDFQSEGIDRVGVLQEAGAVAPLFAAIASARLQARRAVLEVQDTPPAEPTMTVILPCVTLNRSGHDTELLVGAYSVDRRGSKPQDHYRGLGDDPSTYQIVHPRGPLRVADSGSTELRPARDHRQLVFQEWRKRETPATVADPRWKEILQAAAEGKHKTGNYARSLLKSALHLVAQLDPVSATVFLFANGATSIHHTARMHRIARQAHDDTDAQVILTEVSRSLEHLEPARARELLELLLDPQYGLAARS